MTVRLPTDLLERSAEEGARLVALAHLDEITRAQHRLADPADTEALHDFRVGLRRLRSCIRAYRGVLKGSVTKRSRRQLRDLTQETNAGRDTEVQLAWLRERVGRLDTGATEGLAWLIGRLEGRQYETNRGATSDVGRRFDRVATKLQPRLETVKIVVRTGPRQVRPSFGQVTGELIKSHMAELGEKLSAVRSADDMRSAHQARIAVKRLRYLLEPLSRRIPRVKTQVGRLKRLQDSLGDLHDAQVLAQEIASSLATLEEVVPTPGAVPGLATLRGLAVEFSNASFATFQANWTPVMAARFLSRSDELGRILQHRDDTHPVGLRGQAVAGNNGSATRQARSALSVG